MEWNFDKTLIKLRSLVATGFTTKSSELTFPEGDTNFRVLGDGIEELQERKLATLKDFEGVTLEDQDQKFLKYDHPTEKIVFTASAPGGGSGDNKLYALPAADFTIQASNKPDYDALSFGKADTGDITITFAADIGRFDIYLIAQKSTPGIYFNFSAVTIKNGDTDEEDAYNFLPPGGLVWIYSYDGTTFYFQGDLQKNTAPSLAPVITGNGVSGQTLGVNDGYNDEDGDEKNDAATLFQWLIADNDGSGGPSGTIGDIDGATSSTYTLPVAAEGKVVAVDVQAFALTGIRPSSVVRSAWVPVSAPAAGNWHPNMEATFEGYIDALEHVYEDLAQTIAASVGGPVRAHGWELPGSVISFGTEDINYPTLVSWGTSRAVEYNNTDRLTFGDILNVLNPTSTAVKPCIVGLYEVIGDADNRMYQKYASAGVRWFFGGAGLAKRKAVRFATGETNALLLQNNVDNEANTTYLDTRITDLSQGAPAARLTFIKNGDYNTPQETQNPGSGTLSGSGVSVGNTDPLLFGAGATMNVRRVAEIVFDGATDIQLRKAEGFLAHKHGVASILPADHPYKAATPSV